MVDPSSPEGATVDPPAADDVTRADTVNAEAHSGLTERVVRGGTLSAAGLLLSQGLSLVIFVILARLAPPATFGAYAAASILINWGVLFSESGMQAALIQRADRLPEAASTALVANLLGGFALAAVAAALSPLIGLFFHSGEIALAAAVIAGTLPITSASIVPRALLQRHVSFRVALLQPLSTIGYGTVAIATLAGGLGLWGLVLATYAGAAAHTASAWALARWRPTFRLVSFEMWRSLARYGRPVMVGLLLRELGSIATTAVIGRALGTRTLGEFRYAQRLVLQANSAIVFGSASVLFPAFSRIWRDEQRFQHSILRALRTLTLVVFPLSLLFIPLGRPLAVILFGERWEGAGPIMMALSGVGIALSLDSISSEAFKAAGKTGLLPRMHGLTATVPLVLMFPLLHFGAAGVGIAISIGMTIVAAYAVSALRRVAGLSLASILAQIRPAFVASVVMVAALFPLDRYVVHAEQSSGVNGLGRLVLDILCAIVLYLGALSHSRRAMRELRALARLLLGRAEATS